MTESHSANATLDETALRQIETSTRVGTWVYKRHIEECAVRHLMRMGEMSDIKEGKLLLR